MSDIGLILLFLLALFVVNVVVALTLASALDVLRRIEHRLARLNDASVRRTY